MALYHIIVKSCVTSHTQWSCFSACKTWLIYTSIFAWRCKYFVIIVNYGSWSLSPVCLPQSWRGGGWSHTTACQKFDPRPHCTWSHLNNNLPVPILSSSFDKTFTSVPLMFVSVALPLIRNNSSILWMKDTRTGWLILKDPSQGEIIGLEKTCQQYVS